MLLGCSWTASAQGLVDGFYQGKGNFTAILGSGYEDNPTYLAGKTELDLEKSFFNINTFIALGVLNNLDLNIAAAYVQSDEEKALQDAAIALKYKFYTIKGEKTNISFQLASGFRFPLSDYETEGLNAQGQQATNFSNRLIIHAQRDDGLFVTAQAGYDYRFDPVPSSVNTAIKIGFAKSTYYLDAFIDIQNSQDGKDYRGFPAPNNFRELEVDFVRIGTTFYKPIYEDLGGFINLAYTVDGRNVGLGPAINIGLVLRSRL
ncbi:transporter [Nonlabens ponticola]|uniref:Uncharacterized protein n=1 Tax=Nonlabens ponticola TaxID=2496866 RepID=A0A3S9N0B2_9FLAO|nr:transporter [Nonlabens ponticola]AZQ44753.1 hypothetical protein EJ995_11105 [Nonlabens ponticola]